MDCVGVFIDMFRKIFLIIIEFFIDIFIMESKRGIL